MSFIFRKLYWITFKINHCQFEMTWCNQRVFFIFCFCLCSYLFCFKVNNFRIYKFYANSSQRLISFIKEKQTRLLSFQMSFMRLILLPPMNFNSLKRDLILYAGKQILRIKKKCKLKGESKWDCDLKSKQKY